MINLAILLAIAGLGSARHPHVFQYAPVAARWPHPNSLRQ